MGGCLSRGGPDAAIGMTPRVASVVARKKSQAAARSLAYLAAKSRFAPEVIPDFGVSSLYTVMELLGTGGTGVTYLCQHVKTARRVAIKFVRRPLPPVLVPMVSLEVQLQAQLSEGHIGLVRAESALLTRSHFGLAMEYMDGGTLTQYVSRRADSKEDRGGLHLTEDEARYLFRQLISAVGYLHKSHVAHRDLKMCNVVLTESWPPVLKLCDFGFAKGWDEDSHMHTRIGTPVYMSPAQLASAAAADAKATYSATANDVWACGVMLYAMLLGRFPYDHETHPDPNSNGAQEEVWREIEASGGDWQKTPRVAPYIALVSESCRALLSQMLHNDESQRITIAAMREHPWFTEQLPPHLAKPLQLLEDRQHRLERLLSKVTEAQIKARNKSVQDMITMAGSEHGVSPDSKTKGAAGGGGGHVAAHSIFATIVECDRELDSPRGPRTPVGDGAQTPRGTPQQGAAGAGMFRDAHAEGGAVGAAAAAVVDEEAEVQGATEAASGEAKAQETTEAAVEVEVQVLDLSSASWLTKADSKRLLSIAHALERTTSGRKSDAGKHTASGGSSSARSSSSSKSGVDEGCDNATAPDSQQRCNGGGAEEVTSVEAAVGGVATQVVAGQEAASPTAAAGVGPTVEEGMSAAVAGGGAGEEVVAAAAVAPPTQSAPVVVV